MSLIYLPGRSRTDLPPDLSPLELDLWLLVTRSSSTWTEFGAYSPDGRRIAYASSACCGFRPTDARKSLRADLYLMDADGANPARLKFFNERGHPHAEPGGATVTSHRWSRDGRRIYLEAPIYGAFGNLRGSWLKALEFAGACGHAEGGNK